MYSVPFNVIVRVGPTRYSGHRVHERGPYPSVPMNPTAWQVAMTKHYSHRPCRRVRRPAQFRGGFPALA